MAKRLHLEQVERKGVCNELLLQLQKSWVVRGLVFGLRLGQKPYYFPLEQLDKSH